MKVPVMLTIAGSDSSGGAGIQADCAAARYVGVFPICAVSCVTSQGKSGLRKIMPVNEDIFIDQLESAFEDFKPEAVKIGMLPTERHIRIVIDCLRKYMPGNVVLDPIMAPTAGNTEELTKEMWKKSSLLKDISPFITLVTPNLPEAIDLLLNFDQNLYECQLRANSSACAELFAVDFGFSSVLLKGGHGEESKITDTLFQISRYIGEPKFTYFSHDKLPTPNTHGTGCALSSLIASELALGESLYSACEKGISILQSSLRRNSNNQFYPQSGLSGPAFF